MQKRKFDELVSYFNKKVSEMEIETKYKMELLGMVTALGCAHEKEMSDLSETKRESSDTISRQAAINTVSNWLRAVFGVNSNANTIGVLRELRELPSAEPVRKPDEWCTDCKEYDHEKHCCPRFNRVIKSALKVAESDPSDVARDIATIIENEKDMRVIAQPVRKGKWIEEKEDWRNQIMWVSCSECGFASGTSYNFCPNCGADMRGEEDA